MLKLFSVLCFCQGTWMVQLVKRACALLSYQLAPLSTVVQLVLGTWYNPPPP